MTDTQTEIQEGVVVRPGDTLVVRVDQATAQQAEQFKDALKKRLPEVEIFVITGAGQIGVIRKDEP